MKVDWRSSKTTPDIGDGDLVWIYEEFYGGVTLGYFDGFCWRTYLGSDDCSVTHWACVEHPDAPES